MWLIKQHTKEKYGEVVVWIHTASTLAKDGIQRLIHVVAVLHLRNKAYNITLESLTWRFLKFGA